MNAYFFNFKKRPNSTKRPVTSDGQVATVELKEECSFVAPSIKLTNNALLSGTFVPNAFNYVYIPLWQRYYYITDWEFLNGLWSCSLRVDVLASFKLEIGNTSTYIIRSASQYNGDIIDTFYPTTSVKSVVKQAMTSDIYHTTIPAGCFIVGIINNTNNTDTRFGAVTYYALTNAQFSALLNYLFGSNIYNQSGITEVSLGLFQSILNPFQYIVSCMWFPFAATTMTTDQTPVQLSVGYWNITGVNGYKCTKIVREIGFSSDAHIMQHPQSSRGSYMNHEPYSRYTVYYPPFGEIPIDTSFMQYGNNNYLYGKMYIDFITGLAECYFSITDGLDMTTTADPYKYFTMRTAQLGVPVQLAQIMSDFLTVAKSGGTAVAQGLTLNFSGLFNTIANAQAAMMPKVSIEGANGSLVEIIGKPYLICEFSQVVSENRAEFGRPLCDTRTISQLSGYIQCGEEDMPFSGTESENTEINRLMRAGFFYE